MSRPIFSRPRTRVYGCNYDKGESYYKPMVDHLDRKYSSRPLFSEPRTSFADEIAARRSDIGSRSVGGSHMEEFFDESVDGESPSNLDDGSTVDELIMSQRRLKQQETEAFERDLAELRKKRRDMQEKMFDMIDMNAEIERAKLTLEGANIAFSKHATKFDNNDPPEVEAKTMAEKIEKSRKIQAIILENKEKKSRLKKMRPFTWTKMEEIEQDPAGLINGIHNRRARINSIIADDLITETPPEEPARSKITSAPKEKTKKKRSLQKRKKSVSF
ncbi:uncharacterized protein [Venturia canescens]|uniref:uncharacterized protein isoform X2 n=1 Tax=Venturia canescens TaxID=32260 RepID=UPI001C9CEB2A|nr:uncharacterized protein LOC122418068 isoform X2 [Venturia canescens]